MAQMLELIPTSRKKKNGDIAYKGMLNHFIYVEERRSVGKVTWVCEEKRKSECGARLCTNFDMEVVSAQLDMHRNHIADSSKLDLLEAMRALKLRALETQEATSTIVASARHHTSMVATAHLPLADFLRRNVCRYRVAAYTEQRFLQFDTNKAEYNENGEQMHRNPRILVFGTNNSLKALQESQDWFCNETFDVTPKGFAQYYTIHCRLDKGELGVYTLPCLYIFMPNRQTARQPPTSDSSSPFATTPA
uniref:FLYWCH-type domain-containing protein n=1 Tax=Plectus sambesii TaxID=2011161 RepID=A0A914WMI9_9BILA